MFTSDKKLDFFKTEFVYLIFTIITVGFGYGYEQFSHDVYSIFMVYAFTVPLFLGMLPLFLLRVFGVRRLPNRLSLNLYNSGLAALTVGSIFKGVLDIYGTSNDLILIYPIVGGVLVLAGIGAYVAVLANPDSNTENYIA